jgi:hypothetical protein
MFHISDDISLVLTTFATYFNIFVAILIKSTHIYMSNVCKWNGGATYIFVGNLHEVYRVSPLYTINTIFFQQ